MNIIIEQKHKIIRARLALIRAIKKLDMPRATIRNMIDDIINDKRGDFVALSTEKINRLSFAAEKSHKYDKEKRQRVKIHKYIRRVFELSEPDIVFLANIISQASISYHNNNNDAATNNDIQLLTGSDIEDWYRENDETCHSCMTGENSEKVRLYAFNPEKVKLLVYQNRYRALVWNTDDNKKVLDRIYPTDCSAEIKFLENYAEKNGWVIRRDAREKHLPVTLKLPDNDLFPYMDTFQYGTFEDDHLILSPTEGEILFNDTDGNYEGRRCCSYCNSVIMDEYYETINDETYCTDCAGEFFEWCEHCEHWCSTDEALYIEDLEIVVCAECAKNNYIFCESCKKWYENGGIVYYNNGDDDVLCADCIESEKDDGKIYCCEHCYEYHECGGETKTIDGLVCPDCMKYYYKCKSCGQYTLLPYKYTKRVFCDACRARRLENEQITMEITNAIQSRALAALNLHEIINEIRTEKAI